jgi:hypothetical protein
MEEESRRAAARGLARYVTVGFSGWIAGRGRISEGEGERVRFAGAGHYGVDG